MMPTGIKKTVCKDLMELCPPDSDLKEKINIFGTQSDITMDKIIQEEK